MLIANKPCRAIQTFYQLFSPIAWYDTVLWYYPECIVTDKCECITGSFSVWVSVWHSDRVQDLHRAPFVWCWCLPLPLRAPGLLSAPLMPVELYYIKICYKNNIPAITAGGVVRSDALITKQCWTRTHQSLWLMHACYLWSGVRCDWWLFTPCTHSGLAETECRVVCKWDSFEIRSYAIGGWTLHHGGRARQTRLLIDRSDCCSRKRAEWVVSMETSCRVWCLFTAPWSNVQYFLAIDV